MFYFEDLHHSISSIIPQVNFTEKPQLKIINFQLENRGYLIQQKFANMLYAIIKKKNFRLKVPSTPENTEIESG